MSFTTITTTQAEIAYRQARIAADFRTASGTSRRSGREVRDRGRRRWHLSVRQAA